MAIPILRVDSLKSLKNTVENSIKTAEEYEFALQSWFQLSRCTTGLHTVAYEAKRLSGLDWKEVENSFTSFMVRLAADLRKAIDAYTVLEFP